MKQLLLVVVTLACFGTAWAQIPVAKVSNDGTNWTQFEQLITDDPQTGAFNYANTLSGDVVIELLLETDPSYTLTSGFTFNNSMTSLTLRTTNGGNRATLTKSQNSASMFTVTNNVWSLTVENIIFEGSGTSGASSAANGGIFSITANRSSNVVTFTDCDFQHCYVTGGKSGGAIYYSNRSSSSYYGTLNINGCVFNDCKAPDGTSSGQANGGAVYIYSRYMYIDQSTTRRSSFTGCVANRYGGAVMQDSNEARTFSVKHTDFTSCSASLYDGGAIFSDATYSEGYATIIDDCTFTSCSGRYGGAVVLNADNSTVNNTGSRSISSTTFTNCSATDSGGAVYSKSTRANLVVSNCTIGGCQATNNGGALYVAGNALKLRNTVSITNNTINNTTVGNGAGIYMANANGVINIEDDSNGANITVYGNLTSDNQPSDIVTGTTAVPPFEITATSLTGQIGVANTTVSERSLANSTVSHVLGDPIQNMFVDNCGNYAYIMYNDAQQQQIYWYSNVYHFTTAGLWSEAANWQNGTVPYNNVDEIFIDAACQLDQDVNVGTLTITEGTLTLLSGNTLTVNAVLTNTAAEALVIKDGAQLINASPNVAATVEKDITAWTTDLVGGWYTIASPVNSMTIEGCDFLAPNYDLYRFNETNLTHEEWENYKGNLHEDFTTFVNGRGYLYANSNTISPAFVGTLNNAAVTYRITYTNNRPDNLKGFNLIGNPFPHVIYKGSGCAISTSYLASGYYTLSNDGAWQVHTDEDAIQPTQGILVKNSYASRNLTINKIVTPGNSKTMEPRMDISVTGTSGSDRCFAYFCEGIGLDKINNLNENAPSLSIRNGGQDYAIAHLNGECEMLDLMFSNKQAGTYTVTIRGNGMSFDYLHLIDNITGADVNLLRQPDYTFHATGNEFAARFKVVFKPKTGVEENQQESFCFVSGEMLYVNMETESSLLTLTDVLGRVVKSVNMNGNTCSISGLQSGVYVVRLTEGTKSLVQKIVINH